MTKIFERKIVVAFLILSFVPTVDCPDMNNILPGMKAPDFAGATWINDSWNDAQLSDYSGKWLVLFFYPMDFGYISPSEILALEEKRKELSKMGCEIIGVSTDTALVHQKFCSVEPKNGGVKGIGFPLLEDPDHTISEAYGVLRENSGYTFRTYFIIDDKGIVRARVCGDLPVALGIEEIPEKVKNLQSVSGQSHWYQDMNN